MTPDEIRELRKILSCTAKELAAALELEQATVLAWEKGDLFPTKAYIDKMEALRVKGKDAVPRKVKGPGPYPLLSDPAVWLLVRKLLAHKKLREAVQKLSEGYPDPADEER